MAYGPVKSIVIYLNLSAGAAGSLPFRIQNVIVIVITLAYYIMFDLNKKKKKISQTHHQQLIFQIQIRTQTLCKCITNGGDFPYRAIHVVVLFIIFIKTTYCKKLCLDISK